MISEEVICKLPMYRLCVNVRRVCECVSLCGSSVSVCSLSPALHMLLPPGWRLGLSAKGGGGMGGKGGGGSGNIPRAEEVEGGLVSKGRRSRKEKQRRGLEAEADVDSKRGVISHAVSVAGLRDY